MVVHSLPAVVVPFEGPSGFRDRRFIAIYAGAKRAVCAAAVCAVSDRRPRADGRADGGGAHVKLRELRRCYGSVSPAVPSGDRSSVFAFVHAPFTDYAPASSYDQPGSLGGQPGVPARSPLSSIACWDNSF